MIGDIVGRPGRRAVQEVVPSLRKDLDIDLVIANGENSAGGFGITFDTAQEILDAGVNVITSGNHIWKKREIIPYLQEELPILRPSNYPNTAPGRGQLNIGDVMVVNLMGRVFMESLDCPFREVDRLLKEAQGLNSPSIILVDFHAEATSEKQAMGWYLDGRVSAVVGTHTHVPTADNRVLPRGTAYVSDLGMVGPINSVIGTEPNAVVQKFLTQMPHQFTVAWGPVAFNSVLVEIDDETGKALAVDRVDRLVN